MPAPSQKPATKKRTSVGRKAKPEPSLREETGRITSFELALNVLNEFGGDDLELGVQDVSDRLKVHKSQISKVLTLLSKHGYLKRDPLSLNYSVGMRLFLIGSRFAMRDKLFHEAGPIMRDLSEDIGHSVRISVEIGDKLVYLAAVEGPLLFDSERRIGAIVPWHASSPGRVGLAFKSEEDRARILGTERLRAYTPDTITDREQLNGILTEVRSRGYAVSLGQTTVGIGSISAPVFTTSATYIASLSIVFPTHLISDEDVPKLAENLLDYARRLSLRLGAPVYPYGAARARPRTLAVE